MNYPMRIANVLMYGMTPDELVTQVRANLKRVGGPDTHKLVDDRVIGARITLDEDLIRDNTIMRLEVRWCLPDSPDHRELFALTTSNMVFAENKEEMNYLVESLFKRLTSFRPEDVLKMVMFV
jgi:hypothetical protein